MTDINTAIHTLTQVYYMAVDKEDYLFANEAKKFLTELIAAQNFYLMKDLENRYGSINDYS